ncbi:hypothetical protein ACSSS7_005251 [Eimeria intestinalis]
MARGLVAAAAASATASDKRASFFPLQLLLGHLLLLPRPLLLLRQVVQKAQKAVAEAAAAEGKFPRHFVKRFEHCLPRSYARPSRAARFVASTNGIGIYGEGQVNSWVGIQKRIEPVAVNPDVLRTRILGRIEVELPDWEASSIGLTRHGSRQQPDNSNPRTNTRGRLHAAAAGGEVEREAPTAGAAKQQQHQRPGSTFIIIIISSNTSKEDVPLSIPIGSYKHAQVQAAKAYVRKAGRSFPLFDPFGNATRNPCPQERQTPSGFRQKRQSLRLQSTTTPPREVASLAIRAAAAPPDPERAADAAVRPGFAPVAALAATHYIALLGTQASAAAAFAVADVGPANVALSVAAASRAPEIQVAPLAHVVANGVAIAFTAVPALPGAATACKVLTLVYDE